jgi:GT2 family glycosyltransferase
MSKVDVIVPVYRGMELTRQCLERVLCFEQKTSFELVIVDDASPEEGMRAMLQDFASRGGVTLLRNDQNLGFVKSVNRALALHPDRDVVLLNADALVSHDWLDRMMDALSAPRVASVTPFSNNASICSYPSLEGQASWPEGFSSWEETSATFAELNPAGRSEIPCGVGFCMAMKRQALVDCGVFDEALFGTGYGEEVEWCLRARRAGFRHLLAQDVFVAHVGSVSFGNAHRLARLKSATQTIEELYPEWQGLLQSYLENPGDRRARERIDVCRALKDARPRVLHVFHSQGGGVEAHVRDIEIACPNISHWKLRLAESSAQLFCDGPRPVRLSTSRAVDLAGLCETLSLSSLHLHHLMNAREDFMESLKKLSVPMRVTLHDYMFFCPQVNMLDHNDRFCDAPPIEVCERCVNLKQPNYSVESVSLWRRRRLEILEKAEELIAPSPSVAKFYTKIFPSLARKIRVQPHPDLLDSLEDRPAWPQSNGPRLKVLVIGTLDIKKGVDSIAALCRVADNEASIEIHHAGPLATSLKGFASYHHAGDEGDMDNLKRLCEERGIHASWIPSQCPETYSYALSRLLRLGLPIIATRIGALEDRLENLPGVWLLQYASSPQQHLAALRDIQANYLLLRGNAPQIASAFLQKASHADLWKQNSPLQSVGSVDLARNTFRLVGEFEGADDGLAPVSLFERMRLLGLKLRSSPTGARLVSWIPRRFIASLKRRLLKT